MLFRSLRTAERIGDLGSPFYREERQRDVWNEASAVGFQVLLWLLPLAAVASVWIGGAGAVPYALIMFVAPGLTSWVVLLFARAHGVELDTASGVNVLRWRLALYLGLLCAFCAGVLHAVPDGSFARGPAWGALGGAVLGLAAAGRGQPRARRAAEPEGRED